MWSCDADAKHVPPTDFVMNGKIWLTGDLIETVLSNDKGDVSSFKLIYIQAFI